MFSYNKTELSYLNSQHGGGWIKNAYSLQEKRPYHLYPTGHCTLQGREYVAVPSNKPLTEDDKRRLNIM
jgi:hypothetical protein